MVGESGGVDWWEKMTEDIVGQDRSRASQATQLPTWGQATTDSVRDRLSEA